MRKTNTKKIVTIAMLISLSYVLSAFVRFPPLLPLAPIRYSPAVVPAIIGGMVFGPFWAFIMALAVSILHGITVRSKWSSSCYHELFFNSFFRSSCSHDI